MKLANYVFFCLIFFVSMNVFPSLAQAEDRARPVLSKGKEEGGFWSSIGGAMSDALDAVTPSRSFFFGKEKGEEKTLFSPNLAAPETIKAKRLDEEAGAKDADKKVPPAEPYKIYPSPMIAPDPPPPSYAPSQIKTPSPYAYGYREADAPTPPETRPVAPAAMPTPVQLDPSTPPPLPAQVQQELQRDGLALPPPQPAMAEERAAPPLAALSTQFFPVLPAGALPDTMPQLLPVASNFGLEGDYGDATRAVIVIHDFQRNAAETVATLMTLRGQDNGETLIIAPQFPTEVDVRRFAAHLPNEGRDVARWSAAEGWQTGGDSMLAGPASRKGVSSFTALDLLLLFFADKQRFPMMEEIVVAGHGMGGDFVQRYAALGQAPDVAATGGLKVRFLVANPSSYLYFTSLRPRDRGPGFVAPAAPDSCPEMNKYPYGLTDLNAYGRRVGPNEIRLRYPQRRVTYLIGSGMTGDSFLDRNCAATMQGNDRADRARHYARYLGQTFGDALGANHLVVVLPKTGYDPVAVYGSICGMESLFGDGNCRATPALQGTMP